MKVTILGCGPSSGVPLVTGNWGECDPENPKNLRSRPSIVVEQDGFRVLIDTSPDLRLQLIHNCIDNIDGVIYTHEHADHVMGIDDLRGIWRRRGELIDVYGPADVLASLKQRFRYLFIDTHDPDNMYKAILQTHDINGPFRLGPFDPIVPVEQDHGICTSWGYRFGKFAYSTDVVQLNDAAFDALAGIDTWIVDCLRDGESHPTHANLDTTMSWVRRLGVRHTILTHMNFQSDYEAMCRICPEGVEPGYDGMVIEMAG